MCVEPASQTPRFVFVACVHVKKAIFPSKQARKQERKQASKQEGKKARNQASKQERKKNESKEEI